MPMLKRQMSLQVQHRSMGSRLEEAHWRADGSFNVAGCFRSNRGSSSLHIDTAERPKHLGNRRRPECAAST